MHSQGEPYTETMFVGKHMQMCTCHTGQQRSASVRFLQQCQAFSRHGQHVQPAERLLANSAAALLYVLRCTNVHAAGIGRSMSKQAATSVTAGLRGKWQQAASAAAALTSSAA
jgi:hypothetical protein